MTPTAVPPRPAEQKTKPDAELGNWMAWFQHEGGEPFPVEMGKLGPDPIIVKTK